MAALGLGARAALRGGRALARGLGTRARGPVGAQAAAPALARPVGLRWAAPAGGCLARGFATVEVPPMGDSITEGTVASVEVAVGDVVAADQVLVQVETDKVTIDVRSPESGTVASIAVDVDETVTVGQGVAEITPGDGPAEAPAAAEPEPAPEPAKKAKKAPKAAPAPEAAPKAAPTPVAAPKAAPAPAAPTPAPAPAGGRGERRVAMTRMRRRIAERLKAAQNTAAMLTTYNEVDMGAAMELRKRHKDEFLEKHGVKLGFMTIFAKAAAGALQAIPEVNAYIDAEANEIVYRDFVDISVAVGTPKGLVVPVLRNCENLSFAGVEQTIGELGRKARDGTISIDEMAGGTFTISNGGVYGSLLSSPILNPPQSAVLGMHKIQNRPMASASGDVVVRPMMYLALTYDHRLIDGREAVTFLRKIKDSIEDPYRMLLELD